MRLTLDNKNTNTHNDFVANTSNITHPANTVGDLVRSNISLPRPLWIEVNKAALDARKSFKQYVIDVVAEHVKKRKTAA